MNKHNTPRLELKLNLGQTHSAQWYLFTSAERRKHRVNFKMYARVDLVFNCDGISFLTFTVWRHISLFRLMVRYSDETDRGTTKHFCNERATTSCITKTSLLYWGNTFYTRNIRATIANTRHLNAFFFSRLWRR